jgi:transcription antitermination factor NusG
MPAQHLDPLPWYALQVCHKYESVVSSILRNKGYPEFLPLYRARRRWSDRIAEIDLPLFPGYLFCRFDAGDRRVPIVTTPGVVRIVGIGRTPVPVDDAEIAAIQAIVASGVAAEPWPYLRAGHRVRIRHGSLAGVEGILIEARSRHRLVVSVALLQRSVAVEIDSASVVPVGPRPAAPDPTAPRSAPGAPHARI